ncbi:hypothetical protein N7532_006667 [Penicillium argentinense]|uniref:Uncharacterized protein n=1 Tax=Penicillium argentinense TaxID=1131581 RepID=A0A9W9FGD7_9EURO|nr:uncharacterized protein N7532_006667 [Penicillium argentinense]KAJ5099666.1 hypothetical protein N7532_006667 [Penicillium argentinense]
MPRTPMPITTTSVLGVLLMEAQSNEETFPAVSVDWQIPPSEVPAQVHWLVRSFRVGILVKADVPLPRPPQPSVTRDDSLTAMQTWSQFLQQKDMRHVNPKNRYRTTAK